MTVLTFLPILVAGFVSAVIGFVWYHPSVFGSAWMRLSGITPETVEVGKKRMPAMALLALLASVLAAYVINRLVIALVIYDVVGAVKLSFSLWAGFVAPALLGIILWEQKPVALYLINSLYWLVALVAMSLVLVF
ncbi:hypothetical protein A3F27_01065 [Candidatus Kaiserbacteria bacterium RIFCSPHIGHO2_12_FULL_53_13]|uniref:DUF1761 domain-containing protein n=1 Tax=Candidatus Kaiserbacteria bacterium RIFCSPHIGHO2_12_FULL_53_13 TaxID=1798502 RepID=A0A1F6EC52_9BACT|nr:MAG: hypothetical protein A3F27_01065 [Candidatus Kaiserbacteria bacterium RIFCSPHIGHO2_12_FULL_53_13]OGG74551.1 MAG: hypothetical protein A3A37_01640 [Candidatus Kaiserbacteria bacterium RIFCSPLOWO2_01_FULL_52_36]